MDDAFLVRVLDCLANPDEQIQPPANRELGLIAVVGDLYAADQFHYEIRPAGVGGPAVEHFGYVGVVHQRQGLSFRLKTSHH